MNLLFPAFRGCLTSLTLVAGFTFVTALGSSASDASDFSKEDLASGEKLYRNRCAKCHKMYDPARYTDRQWSVWMQKMTKKARLKGDQKEAVNGYIETVLRHPEAGKTNGSTTAQR